MMATADILQAIEKRITNAVDPIQKSISTEILARRLIKLGIKASAADPYVKTKALHDRVRNSAEKIYQTALNRVLASFEAKTLVAIRSARGPSVAASRKTMTSGRNPTFIRAETTPTEVNLDLAALQISFRQAMDEAAAEAYVVTARGLAVETLNDDEKLTDSGVVKKFVFARQNRIKDCPQNIFDQVQKSLQAGDAKGETMKQLTDRVSATFKDIEKGRAFVIARTESQAAYGTAQMATLLDAGYKKKFWQSSDDELVRKSHMECEGQGPIPIDDDFVNGLAFPGDPDCEDASEVVGCRCYLVKGEDADKGDEEDDE